GGGVRAVAGAAVVAGDPGQGLAVAAAGGLGSGGGGDGPLGRHLFGDGVRGDPARALARIADRPALLRDGGGAGRGGGDGGVVAAAAAGRRAARALPVLQGGAGVAHARRSAVSARHDLLAKAQELLIRKDGPLTRELVLTPGNFGLGKVPARLAPTKTTSMV